MKRILLYSVLAGIALPAALTTPARADLPPLIPRAVLLGNPVKAAPQISPDGTRFAFLAPNDNNVLQVWVQTVGKEDAQVITKDPKRGIRDYFWAPNGKSILYLQDNDGDENFHAYQADLSTNETKDLTPYPGVRVLPVASDPDFPNECLLAMNKRDKKLFDVYRLNLTSGELTVEAENPGTVGDWTVDEKLQVRGRTLKLADGGSELDIRDTPTAEWKKVMTWTAADEVNAIGFNEAGNAVYLLSNQNANSTRLMTLDPASGKTKMLAEDPQYDVSMVAMNPRTNGIQAVQYNRARHEWKVIDSSVKSDFAELPKLSDGDFSPISRTQDDQTWLVAYTRDLGGVKYYAWNRKTHKGDFLFSAQPKLDDYTLSPMEPVVITARDGLKLQCYLTKPQGVAAKNLPLVLYVHGGPWARDSWGFSSTPQWLANRGYACLQVNYRGSTGFGKPFLHAGDHEFAGKMHNDLLDAVDWAVKSGLADPKKVAIMGGSYGGYATLVGVTFTPETFACGVDLVGPSNLVSLIESFPPYWKPFLASSWYPRVGDPSDPAQRKDLESRSPLFKVDQIKAPLMIVQGANDPRVNKKESDQIVEAMKKSGKDVEYYIFGDEGHGLARPENRIKYAGLAERFLAKYLGGRAEEIPADQMMESSAANVTTGAK